MGSVAAAGCIWLGGLTWSGARASACQAALGMRPVHHVPQWPHHWQQAPQEGHPFHLQVEVKRAFSRSLCYKPACCCILVCTQALVETVRHGRKAASMFQTIFVPSCSVHLRCAAAPSST